MSQRPIVISGMGGQGVQLAAQTLCRAAVLEGREAQYFSFVGGVMRGGMSSAYVVLADGPVNTPPLFGRSWAGIPLHRDYADAVLGQVDGDSIVAVDPSMVDAGESAALVVEASFGTIARAADAAGAMSLVAISVLAATTRLLDPGSLIEAMRSSLPSYRSERAAANERAIEAGFAAAAPRLDAWSRETAGRPA